MTATENTSDPAAASKTISILLLGMAAMEEHDVDMVSIATSLRDNALQVTHGLSADLVSGVKTRLRRFISGTSLITGQYDIAHDAWL